MLLNKCVSFEECRDYFLWIFFLFHYHLDLIPLVQRPRTPRRPPWNPCHLPHSLAASHKTYFQLIFQLPGPMACHLLLAQHKSQQRPVQLWPAQAAHRFPRPQSDGYNGIKGWRQPNWQDGGPSLSPFLVFCKASHKDNPNRHSRGRSSRGRNCL